MHPILLHLGHLTIPTFGPLAALGLMAALWLSQRCASRADLPRDTLWNASFFAAVSAFVLSRLLLVAANLRSFFAYPLVVLTLPSLTPLGLFLTAIATLAYLRLKRIPVLSALDAWAAPVSVLWAFLSLGHLAEGTDPGLPSRASWAVRMPPDPDLQQPVSLFAAMAAGVIAIVLYRNLGRRPRTPGHTLALALLLAGVAQFFLTFLRQPFPYAPDSPSFPLDPIQMFSLVAVLGGSVLYVRTSPGASSSTMQPSPHCSPERVH
ncbi:MAG: hypothetical protein NVSMB3_04510 [Acidobacteriaceae bacterium]